MKSIFVLALFNTILFALPNRPTLVEKVTPFQKWSKLGSRTIGVLSQREIAGIYSIDWTREVHQSNETMPPGLSYGANTYEFNLDDNSPLAVYFKSSGEGVNFMKGWTIGGLLKNGIDSAAFTPTTQNKWGLNKGVHLVDAQVNGGIGGGENVHFIITDAKVLDGTPAFPFNPDQLATDFLSQFSEKGQKVADLQKQLLDRIGTEERSNPDFSKLKNFSRSLKAYAGHHISWLANDKVLRIVYYRKAVDNYQVTVIERPKSTNPKLGPPARRINYNSQFGAEVAVQADYYKDGKLKAVTVLPMESFVEVKLPPN